LKKERSDLVTEKVEIYLAKKLSDKKAWLLENGIAQVMVKQGYKNFGVSLKHHYKHCPECKYGGV